MKKIKVRIMYLYLKIACLFLINYLNIDQNKLFVISSHWRMMDDEFYTKKEHRLYVLSIARKVGSSNARRLYLVVDISCSDSHPTPPMFHWFGQQRRNGNIHIHRRDLFVYVSLLRISRYYEGDNYEILESW